MHDYEETQFEWYVMKKLFYSEGTSVRFVQYSRTHPLEFFWNFTLTFDISASWTRPLYPFQIYCALIVDSNGDNAVTINLSVTNNPSQRKRKTTE